MLVVEVVLLAIDGIVGTQEIVLRPESVDHTEPDIVEYQAGRKAPSHILEQIQNHSVHLEEQYTL